MSMGFVARSEYRVQDNFVKETCPVEWEVFFRQLDAAFPGDNYADIFAAHWYEPSALYCDAVDKEAVDRLVEAAEALCDAFRDTTGLIIRLNTHDKENEGSRYDDVDGYFWQVENALKFTAVAEANKQHLERVDYVQLV